VPLTIPFPSLLEQPVLNPVQKALIARAQKHDQLLPLLPRRKDPAPKPMQRRRWVS
jgi:hypothetical protein